MGGDLLVLRGHVLVTYKYMDDLLMRGELVQDKARWMIIEGIMAAFVKEHVLAVPNYISI